jgi:hypothetical protein
MPSPMPKFVRLKDFIADYAVRQQNALNGLAKENRIVFNDDDFEEANERLEELIEQEEWAEEEMAELSALFFCIAYVNKVRGNEDGEG